MTGNLVTEVIGYAAAVLGTFVMLPQVWKSIRTRSAHDLSWVMLAVYLIQCVLWGIYGTLLGAVPLIACNVVAFLICSCQVVLKLRYERTPAIGLDAAPGALPE